MELQEINPQIVDTKRVEPVYSFASNVEEVSDEENRRLITAISSLSDDDLSIVETEIVFME